MSAPPPHPSDQSVFMRACRREPVPHTPIWLMRQAGRYMEEYRAVRAKTTLLDLCKSPDLVSEVTVTAARRLGVDAAILFADLLLVVEPLGLRLEFSQGEGPVIDPPVRDGRGVDSLREVRPEDLAYVFDAVRATRRDLDAGLPLIGFAGAPFTVASYLIEGRGSRHYAHTKRLMYGDEGAWNALMEKLVRAQTAYLNRQIEAGCQAVQLFDSWVGALSPTDYRRYVKPHVRALLAGVTPGVPVLHFGTGTAALLADMRDAGGSVIGLDWRVDLDRAWSEVGYDRAIMGNLDPLVLLAEPAVVEREAGRILDQAAGRPGHVFNLGHGILPETPVDHVIRLVQTVHERSARTAPR
ncbi:MAG: uroporphyrinogen decarboxylase [Candidatus Eiseniibacteriota bacterium]